jgi:two-component system CheB/CheR fusion protein
MVVSIVLTAIFYWVHVVVSVRDEGYGIPEQDLQRIFERFFRVTSNNMDTYPGMGLGLYVTAQIVRRHGVRSRVGEERCGDGGILQFEQWETLLKVLF